MLVELVQSDQAKNSGLRAYLRNMMLMMNIDARRRGRLISQAELNEYTLWLAIAVTEALHYFIGHGAFTLCHETRYLAVSVANITHMRRDTYDDVQLARDADMSEAVAWLYGNDAGRPEAIPID
jgi:hypothetical protein